MEWWEGGWGEQSYLPPLSRGGHEEGTLGSPAGRKAGRVGGVPPRFKLKCVGRGMGPFAIGAKTAPESTGALVELAMRPLWRQGSGKALLGTQRSSQ